MRMTKGPNQVYFDARDLLNSSFISKAEKLKKDPLCESQLPRIEMRKSASLGEYSYSTPFDKFERTQLTLEQE